MNTQFSKKLLDMKTENLKTRRRVVFIDSVVAPGCDVPTLEWKSFSKLQKIKKMNEYFKINSISTVLSLENFTSYKISSIVFCKTSQQVKNLNVSKRQ